MLMSQAEFARKINRTRQYVNKMIKKGILPTYQGNKVKYEESKKILEEIKDPRREPQREANERRRESKSLFTVAGSYESVADMSEDEKRLEIEKRKKELSKLKQEAKKLGVDEELPKELNDLSIKELNALKLKQELRILEVKADEAEKKVIAIDEVNRQLFTAARLVRDGLLSIPPRLATRMAATNDPHLCRTMLEEEITNQLQNLTEALSEL